MTLPEYTETKRTESIEENAEEITTELESHNLSTHLEFDPVENLTVLLIDRSGSIVEEDISQIEDAVLTLGLALESLGCKVCVVDIYGCEARLISQFDEPLTTACEDILTGEVKGSTPVKNAIKTVREESMYFDENELNSNITSFIAFTDGLPNDPDGAATELDNWGVSSTAIVPLLASHVDTMHSRITKVYDNYTIVRDADQWNFLTKEAWLHNTLFKSNR